MNPGNTSPYIIKGDNNTCLRTPNSNNKQIHNSDKWTCTNSNQEEAWFYTADKKLLSANDGRAACGDQKDEGNVYTCDASQGTKWDYDSATRRLKIAGTNYCLYMSERKNTWDGKTRTDIRTSGCNPTGSITVAVASDTNNHDTAECKRSDQHSFASIFKAKIEPSDEKKYECCSKNKEGTTSAECGYNYCNENGSLTDACKTFLAGTYCRNNANLPLCREYAELSAKADYCSVGTRLLTDQICKDTCNMDNEIVRSKCEQTAMRLCKENPDIPQCGCFGKIYDSNGNLNTNDPDYIQFTRGMDPSKIPSLGEGECWLQPCAASTLPFSELFRRKKGASVTCPLCIQSLNINNSNFDDVAIKQSCTAGKSDSGGGGDSKDSGGDSEDSGGDSKDSGGGGSSGSGSMFFISSSFSSFFIMCAILVLGGLIFASFSEK